MKSMFKTLLSLILLIGLATSCKKPVPSQVKHIPKNATFIAAINAKAITSKMLANQATIENIMKSASGNDSSNAKGKQEWEDMKESGIDFTSNFYLSVAQKDGNIATGKGSMIIAALGTINSEEKLEKYLKKKMPQVEIKKDKNFSYTTIEGDNMVAWSKDLVVAMSYQSAGGREMEYDSATGQFNLKPQANPEGSLKAEMDNYFTMKEDNSVASIPEFREMMQNSADASMWINTSASVESIPLPKVKELFGNSYTAATLNFEDGKVVMDSKSYYSNEMKNLLKKYMNGQADMSLIEKYPSSNINGFLLVAMNPEFFNDMVKQLELGGMADAQLTRVMGSNYTLGDMLKALKGDMIFVISDLVGSQFKMLGNLAVGDKTQMNKLMDKLVEMKMMAKSNGGYALSPDIQMKGLTVSVDDKNILLSNNDTLVNAYKASSGKVSIDKEVMNELSGKQLAMYINMQSIMNGVSPSVSQDSAVNNSLVKAKETFKDMRMFVNKYDGKELSAHFELNFMNTKENSLTSILKLGETVSQNINNKSRELKMDMPVIADTIPVSMR